MLFNQGNAGLKAPNRLQTGSPKQIYG